MTLDTLARTHGESFEPRYDLPQEQQDAITRDATANIALPAGRFVCMFVTEGPMTNVARSVEREVFEGAFSNDDDVMKTEYGPYDTVGARKFAVVVDTNTQRTAGALSVLENSSIGFKSMNDAAKPEYLGVPVERLEAMNGITNPDTCWVVGTVAVTDEYRGGQSNLEVSSLLYRMLLLAAEREGITDFVSIIDKKAKSNLDAVGVPFSPMADSKGFEYLGSPESYAVHGKVDEFVPSVARRARLLKPLAAIATSFSKVFGIESKKVKRLAVAARVAGILATGRGLDDKMVFSA